MVITPPATQVPPSAMAEIERLGYKHAEVAQYDLSQLSKDRRVQVRETAHYAPKEAVARYAVQMGQSQFPPIVVTKDNWLIDGNTRVGAAEKRDLRFFPAIVLDVEYAGRSTTSKTQATLRALAMTLNASHGVPLTAKETRDGARDLISLGWKSDQIARAIGLKPTSISAVRREIDAEDKLTRVGLGGTAAVQGASLRALGSKDAMALNDDPFRELAKLAADASLNTSEITSAAKEVRQVGSESGQLDRLAQMRTEHGDRIRERQLTGRGKPPVARQIRQHLGNVLKYEGNEQEMLETDPACLELAMKTIDRALAVLTALREMQKPASQPGREEVPA